MSDLSDTTNAERLLATDDAAHTAAEFVALHGGDEGLMIGWFANAMETAKRIERNRYPDRKPVMDRDFAVLSREALLRFFGEVALPPWRDAAGNEIGDDIDCAAIADRITTWLAANDLGDLYVTLAGGSDD